LRLQSSKQHRVVHIGLALLCASAMKVLIASVLLAAAPLAANGVVVQHRGCEAYAMEWLSAPATKEQVKDKANAACQMDQDIKQGACARYGKLIDRAFHYKHSKDVFSSKDFCTIMEAYVQQMDNANKVPYMGKGEGADFKLDKTCKIAARKSMAPNDDLPAESAPNFWFALCMHQDCAHFLPSRSRFCTVSHEPTHSASVCDALRTFVEEHLDLTHHTHTSHVKEDELCSMYDGFVETTHSEREAYMHVVHGEMPGHSMSNKIITHPHSQKSAAPLVALPSVAVALLAMAA